MDVQPIKFNQPVIVGNEMKYVADAVARGHTASSGQFTSQVETLLSDWFDAGDVILTTSCTDALELAALLCDFEPGDEVIVPSFTFVSTALAFARAGATLVFADIEDQQLSLDPSHVKSLISPQTRAIVTVHYAGIGGPVSELASMTSGSISLVEDNAHGLYGSVEEGKLGTFGRFATQSFHETKNFSCGEGGALIVNDADDRSRARILTDKGTNRRAFFEGEVDKYSWQDTGSSFGLADVLAAFLLGQLERRDEIQATRRHIFDSYMEAMRPLEEAGLAELPNVPQGAVPAYHMFHVLVPTSAIRTRTLQALRARSVNATFHYVPLHSSPAGQRFSKCSSPLPVTDDISSRLIRLPFHNALTELQIERVASVTSEVISDVA